MCSNGLCWLAIIVMPVGFSIVIVVLTSVPITFYHLEVLLCVP